MDHNELDDFINFLYEQIDKATAQELLGRKVNLYQVLAYIYEWFMVTGQTERAQELTVRRDERIK